MGLKVHFLFVCVCAKIVLTLDFMKSKFSDVRSSLNERADILVTICKQIIIWTIAIQVNDYLPKPIDYYCRATLKCIGRHLYAWYLKYWECNPI